jgi:two-component system chemotaxis sensor kinase CheA
MDRAKLLERLMATFLGELSEHVRTINGELLALEKGPEGPERAERFKTLLRSAHSLKGAARSVDVGLIEETCHRLEEILIAARDGRTAADPGLFALLYAAADALEESGMRLREQSDLSESPLAALLPRLEGVAAGGLTVSAPPPPFVAPPPSAPAPAPVRTEGFSDPLLHEGGGSGWRAPSEDLLPTPHPGPPPQGGREKEQPQPPGPASGGRPPEGLEKQPPPGPAPGPGEPARPRPSAAGPGLAASPGSSPVLPRGHDGGAFVRVPAEKLDALLARSGELLVARRRAESRGEALAGLRDALARWGEEWRASTRDRSPGAGPGPDAAPNGAAAPGPERAAAQVGERLGWLEKELERFALALAGDQRHLARAAGLLDEEVRRVRMLPFAEACQGLERVVRDAAQAEGKRAALAVEGGDVELDRSVLEGLKDPLTHLVRNAVGHGVEPPEARRAAGKPEAGRVAVTAALRGGQVEVVVADDGAGLDLDALHDALRGRGMVEPADDRDLVDAIFLPGFSTAARVTNLSGRGVGLDVVKSRVEALHGTVAVASEPGRGTRFTLAVPLTLTTLRALLLTAGGQPFVLASAHVEKLVRVDPSEVRTVGGRAVLAQGGAPIPVAPLADLLGLPDDAPARPAGGGPGKRPGAVVVAGDRRVAVLVDELLAEQEVTVKSLGDRVRRVRSVSGATLLPDGRVALVLNPSALTRAVPSRAAAATGASPARGSQTARRSAPAARKRLLVVDDSVTTRTLEKGILESAGYEVLTAVDGEDGWRVLERQGADLLITDVEMPRMDGFALTEAVRRTPRFESLPVVLFTSRASESDRARGIEVGADAYIVKSAFDQNDLLETIAQLL